LAYSACVLLTFSDISTVISLVITYDTAELAG
jgi:hypothetical protein